MFAGPYRTPPSAPPSCLRHPGDASGTCPRCGRCACDRCLLFVAGRAACLGCATPLRVRDGARRLALAALLTAALSAPLVALFAMDRDGPPPDYDRLVVRSCDERGATLRMTEHYLANRLARA